MKRIELTRGKFAIVDDKDYEIHGHLRWHAQRDKCNFYAARGIETKNGPRNLRLHRIIAGAKPGQIVDHVNRNSLDNRRINLRICSHAENGRNRTGPQSNSTSGYRGITWNKQVKKWMARIGFNNSRIYLGIFKSLDDAALAYRKANRKYFGKYGGGL